MDRNEEFSFKYIKGKIYTANITNDFVEGIIIKDDKIIFLGSSNLCENFLHKNNISLDGIQLISLNSNEVAMPGFIDSHVHPNASQIKKSSLDLSDCGNIEEFHKKISDYVNNNSEIEWVIGSGYSDDIFDEENPLSYKILDQICKYKPIVIYRYDFHACCLNSKGIELININKNSPNPEAGVIEKDKNGELVGVLHDAAMVLLNRIIPKKSKHEKIVILEEVLHKFMSLGIVGFMDAAVRTHFEVYKELYLNKSLVLPRCALSMCIIPIFFDPSDESKDDEPKVNESILTNGLRTLDIFFKKNRIKDWDSFTGGSYKLRVNTVKIFLDGVMESGTALASCNCSSNNDVKTEQVFTHNELLNACDYFYENDIQMHCHSIGDLAAKSFLDAMEETLRNKDKEHSLNKLKRQNHYLAHCQIVNNKDYKRFLDMNISANFSPYWFKSDSFTSNFQELIKNDLSNEPYPIKTMKELGINVCFGSDWAVSTLNPLDGIEVAITHRELGCEFGEEKDSYNPYQNLTLFDSLKAYMSGSAVVLGLDQVAGTLEIGKFADIIVLDKDIFSIKSSQIHTATVVLTMIGGIVVFSKK